ncbi:MAG: tRNA 2-selenouridine(34) synthase MnmH [Bacteroidales bacterium]|nr:tRNA 2-selenouridine(34) synthase MnmH [Bacteroidales bacterium]
MPNKIDIQEFLNLGENTPIIDVRTPAEFEQGHIPGAYNIPLFSNEERVLVGTRYKQAGKDFAVQLGLEIVGPKLANYTKQAKKIAKDKKLLIHCWRGGMRSGSMAWLFEITGLKVDVLIDGYKAYRTYIREKLGEEIPLRILGGYTGSGKTDILHEMRKMGEQMIDLEGIAHHKGSAFGTIGQLPQPTNEQFENNLAKEWLKLDPNRIVWLEDESITMGRCGIPSPLFIRMREAQVVNVDAPRAVREQRLVKEYANGDIDALKNALERISRKLGGLKTKLAMDALQQNDFRLVAEITLEYYDKAYGYGIDKRDVGKVKILTVERDDPASTAKMILDL